jgi:amidase
VKTKLLLTAAFIIAGLSACGPAQNEDVTTPIATEAALRASYAPSGWAAKTLPELSEALQNGDVSSEELVTAYLARIEAIDRAGPKLQSVLALNPNALDDARALDAKRAAGEPLGSLHGIPVLLKDIIESKDPVATTAGSTALRDNVTGRDSPLVAGLRGAGAVILGKANLSQWANYRSNSSMSGWTSMGGQVRNPHMLDRNPCGSSSGSGAAAAASLAAGTVGTETNGSIICPSTVNGIVGFKPTVGLVSQQYIVPISSTQDTAGPMTKTVKGAAMMLEAMAVGGAKTDYVSGLDVDKLDGARIGVLRYAEGSNADIIDLFNVALAEMQSAGATLVEIDSFRPKANNFGSLEGDLLHFEFKATMNAYLADAAPDVKTRNLTELIAFNKANADVEMALFDQSIFVEAQEYGSVDSTKYKEVRKTLLNSARTHGIDALLAENNVDILVAPSGPVPGRIDPINGDVWPRWAGAGSLAAIAGYPHLSVPMGTVHGLPVGVSFIGAQDKDVDVLSFGYAYEKKTNMRAEPKYLRSAEDRPEIAKAMQK